MSSIPPFINDLGIILIAAGITTIVFKLLKQPVVLGYILAGIISGPFISLFPTVSGIANIKIWADIGVIFLLFALGLEFSFKKLLKLGGTIFVSTLTIVCGMMTFGYAVGTLFGWSGLNSIFLGAMLCMSSTMIIIKVFEEMGLQKQSFTGIVTGILVAEDLVAVLLLVLLSTIAASNHFESGKIVMVTARLVSFLLFWFLVGIYVIPSLLKKFRKYLNDETLLILSLGLCLLMVILATKAGFSSALGAFMIGSILAETIEAEKIINLLKPLKNLFGAIFFVSVGMMINIPILKDYIPQILILSAVVILGQIFFGTIGVVLSGKPLGIAMKVGFSLTQIGEFSYIIASLGLSLGVMDSYLYPVIIAVSVVTIFTTPYMIRLADPLYRKIEKILPEKWNRYLYKNESIARPVNQENTWKNLIQAMIKITAFYLSLSLVIIFLFYSYVRPLIMEHLHGIQGRITEFVLVILAVSPFLRAAIMKKNRSADFTKLWNESKVNRGPLLFTVTLRAFLCIVIVTYLGRSLLRLPQTFSILLAILIIIVFIFSKGIKRHSIRMENIFKNNLNERQLYKEKHSVIKSQFVDHLLTQDLHLAEFEIKQSYSIVGKTLRELNFRQVCGVNVVTIDRGEIKINIPGGDERLFPMDKIILVGTDEQMNFFQHFIESKKYIKKETTQAEDVNIGQIKIENSSTLVGKKIRNSKIRDDYNCLVVGVERNNESVMNPSVEYEFQSDDIIWVVGEMGNIRKLSKV